MDASFFVVLFVIASALTFIYKTVVSLMEKERGSPIPGPKPLMLFGNIFDIDCRRLHLSFSNIAKWYGSIFKIKIYGQTVIVINDSNFLGKMSANEDYGENFNNRPVSFVRKYLVYNNNDVSGKTNRKTQTMRNLLIDGLKLYGDGVKDFDRIMEEAFRQFIEDIENTHKDDFNIYQIIRKSLGKVTASLLTGKPTEDVDNKIVCKFVDDFSLFADPSRSLLYEILPFIRLLPGKYSNNFQTAKDARDCLLQRFYFQSKDNFEKCAPEKLSGFVAALLQLQREENIRRGEKFITEKDIIGIVLDMVYASTEPMVAALCNSFSLLLENRDVAVTIQSEIDHVIGRSRTPNRSDEKDMPYTMATILEILRYTSPVPLSIPHSTAQSCTFEGFYIPKNALIFPNLWYIHHDPKIWEGPWVFRPERFLDSDGKLLHPGHRSRQSLFPFSIGSRSCLSEHVSKLRMFMYITSMLQSFDILPPTSGQIPNNDPRHSDNGSTIRVKPFLCRALPRL